MPGNVNPVADEREGLLAYLAQQRYVLRLAAHGLTDAQARAVPTKSSLSVGGVGSSSTSRRPSGAGSTCCCSGPARTAASTTTPAASR